VKQILKLRFKHAVPDYLIFGFVFACGSGSWFGISECRIESDKEVNADGKDHCSC
jgi:hypothetical protein